MECALYDPQGGYYSTGPQCFGPAGDYITAADAGPWFGRCLLAQLAEIDRRAGPFDPFRVVEFGAGRGWLARDVLDAGRAEPPVDASGADGSPKALARRLSWVLVERSAALRGAAAERVPEALVVAPGHALARGAGAAVAVELFDALPVHRLRRRQGRLCEVYVDLDLHTGFVEVEGPPSPQAAGLAAP